MMKTIGFIDYYIDEWHANTYPSLIEKYNENNGTDYQVKYVWAELDASPKTGGTTAEWCEKYGATACASIEELCALADHVIVLSPSDPERHLDYARRVFACKKNAYIDKTFASSVEEAEQIFDAARLNGVKFFSSSALRYADEIAGYNGDARVVAAIGCGGNIDEYLIHQVEMIVKCLGKGAKWVKYASHADQQTAEIHYDDDRYASVLFAPYLIYGVTVAGPDGVSKHLPVNSAYFYNLISDIIRFFEDGETSFDPTETLEVMKVRAAILAARDSGEIQNV